VIGLAGCSIVPREGPLSSEIEQQSLENDFIVIDITSDIVRTLAGFDPVGLSKRFRVSKYRAPTQYIGVGDVLAVSIFEAGQDGLFSGDNGSRAEFPSIAVDRKGMISIPYAGLIPVKGRTAFQVQEEIVDKLKGKAIQPQAVVNIVRNENNTVAISGGITKPGLYPISVRGRRLLDVIAEAGGTKYPARETYVSFVRSKKRGVQLLKTIMETPEENVYVSNGDRIYLSHDPQHFTVLGAVSKPGLYNFDAPRISILEAVASAGGLLDARADSTGLFVFRYELPKVLKKIGIAYGRTVRGRVPTIYRINMKHAKSYFYAQSFLLQDKDSIFVSNATGVEIMKMLKIINSATASFRGGVGVVNTVKGF
jgi:polysaccharide export outer membrane protein